MLIVSALSNMETRNRASCDPKTQHLASSVWWCTVLLEHVKNQLSPQTRKFDRFARFCGCKCKTSNIWHQRPRFFTIEAGYQLAAPIGISLFVPVTHYNVGVTSRLAKNIKSNAMFC